MSSLLGSQAANAPYRAQRAFTLLELLVVVMVISILVGLVVPRFFSHVGRSEIQAARVQIDSLEKALEAFRLDAGRLPSSSEGLAALVEKPSGLDRWRGPYLRKGLPKDPWGNAYIYKIPGPKYDFQIISLGKDGVAGGEGDDTDLTSDSI